MAEWTSRQRFEAVFAGEPADRPPVSAWKHFLDAERDPAALARATVAFHQAYGWDFIKLNPRATYYAEAWGTEFDYGRYEGVVPAIARHPVRGPEDLGAIEELGVASAPTLAEHVEAVRLTREAAGPDVPILQTVFSPLAVLEYLAGRRALASNRPAVRAESPLPRLFAADPEGTHRALRNIARTLAAYVEEVLRAGADGIFYAVMGIPREGYLTEEEYRTFGRPYDLMVVEAAGGAPVMLHTCGPQAHPERFGYDGVKAIHWADRAPGNPSLADMKDAFPGKALAGGVDESLFAGEDADAVRRQAREAVQAMKNRAFVLAAGCGVPVNATPATLRALRESAV